MPGRRRLQISTAGFWYIGLTILLGVTAMTSGNSIIYLFESLLLSGLILSGILSERAVTGLRVEIRRRQARALEPSRDPIHIHNKRRYPLFCMEIGEWKNRSFVPIAFIPRIGPRSSLVLSSRQALERRGIHDWQGIAIATSFPFGFARKILIVDSPGKRLVWPASDGARLSYFSSDSANGGSRAGTSIVDGEVRPIAFDDDCRLIVWPLSAKGAGPMVRVRKAENQSPETILDLRTNPGEEFEKKIREAARKFYTLGRLPALTDAGSLTLLEPNGRRRIQGSKNALDQLAVARALGAPGQPARGNERKPA